MANEQRGQVLLQNIGGRDLTLEFSIDAMCVLETKLKTTAKALQARMGTDESLTFLRSLLWGALREHHPEFTEKTAGELIRQPGGDQIAAKIIEAWVAAWPSAEDMADDSPQPEPPTVAAEDGTGDTSSASGASST